MQTRVVRIETTAQFECAVAETVCLLKEGQVVAVPTETVYGLAANAFDPEAVRGIYRAKGRPAHNPIIVHVSSVAMARRCVAEWPEDAEKLAAHFWPGPLTLVLPRANNIPDVVTGGGTTVGVRLPLHPFIRRVIERCDFPLAAPSANPANQLSPTTAAHVSASLNGRIPLIVDAGPTSVGIESTVLDLSGPGPAVLRPGMISATEIEKALGKPVRSSDPNAGAVGPLKSPGQLQKHYAPQARLVLGFWKDDADLAQLADSLGTDRRRIHIIAYEHVPEANPYGRVALIPHDPEAYARALYAELHRSDQLGASLILVESPPEGAEWEGIRDRLKRASV